MQGRPPFVNLNPNKYNEGLRYYPFTVNLDNRSCNNLNNTSYKTYSPNKTEDVNLSVFKMIARINE